MSRPIHLLQREKDLEVKEVTIVHDGRGRGC